MSKIQKKTNLACLYMRVCVSMNEYTHIFSVKSCASTAAASHTKLAPIELIDINS